MIDSIDQAFFAAIKKLVDLDEELLFERRGSSNSNYEFHGKVVSLDEIQARVGILRTRSHAGETHWMNIRYFLRVTRPNGATISNALNIERDLQYRKKQEERDTAITAVLQMPSFQPGTNLSQSSYCGRRDIEFDGQLLNLYVFSDMRGSGHPSSFVAHSLQAACHFMSLQDLYLTLNDMLPHAIKTYFFWPSWIQLQRRTNPAFWSIDWLKICDQLVDVPHAVLDHYFKRVLYVQTKSFCTKGLTEKDVQLLLRKGMIRYESDPQKPEDVLDRVQMPGLRLLLIKTGFGQQYGKRDQLVTQLMVVMSPDLHAQAKLLMRPPKLMLGVPGGLDLETFREALDQLRTMIYMQRQWLRDYREAYSDQDVRALIRIEKRQSNPVFPFDKEEKLRSS